jgi:hypothetical protein
MNRGVKPDLGTQKLAADQIAAKGLNAAAQRFGVAPQTLQRLADGFPVSPGTIEQVKPKVRAASEFRTQPAVSPPDRTLAAYTWPLKKIRAARDAQLAGRFREAVQLATAMRTDDAMYVAYHNRIAPQSAVNATLTPRNGARGIAVCNRVAGSCFVSRSVLAGINGTMANHGVAIGYNLHEPNAKGTRVDFRHIEWPLEFVEYHPQDNTLWTSTKEGPMVPINHGDGRWTVYRKFYDRPWTQEAALIPGAMIYAAHANGVSDLAGASRAHGMAKVLGEMAPGISMQGQDAAGHPILSPDAMAMLNMLTAIMNGDTDVGILPNGAKADVLFNGSTAWQIWDSLLKDRKSAAAFVYLGTDGTLGVNGGGPGVDISALFGVSTTKVQGDLTAIEQGLDVGVYQPHAAINYGDSRYAPSLVYELPDPDADERREQHAAGYKSLTDTVKELKDNGFDVTQGVVDALAKQFGVSPIPQLAAAGAAKVTVVLAPTDVAKVTRGIEARNANGLPPFNDERDNMTIDEITQAAAAKAKASEAQATANAQAQAQAPAQPAPTA